MPTLIETYGYAAPSIPVAVERPMSVYAGHAPRAYTAGEVARIMTDVHVVPGESPEVAIAFCDAGHGDPNPAVAGVAPLAVANVLSMTLAADIPAGSALYVIAAPDKSPIVFNGAATTDAMSTGRVSFVEDFPDYKPSAMVGKAATFASSATAAPFRASVLLP